VSREPCFQRDIERIHTAAEAIRRHSVIAASIVSALA